MQTVSGPAAVVSIPPPLVWHHDWHAVTPILECLVGIGSLNLTAWTSTPSLAVGALY
jgi:hypothetical protein